MQNTYKDRHSSSETFDTNSNGISDHTHQLRVIKEYGKWIRSYWNRGWKVYFFSVVFNQIPGSRERKREQMFQEINWVYNRLLTRLFKKPRSWRWHSVLPNAVFVLDRPIPKDKKRKQTLRHLLPNDGLHVHGLVVVKPGYGKIKEPLDQHFPKTRTFI